MPHRGSTSNCSPMTKHKAPHRELQTGQRLCRFVAAAGRRCGGGAAGVSSRPAAPPGLQVWAATSPNSPSASCMPVWARWSRKICTGGPAKQRDAGCGFWPAAAPCRGGGEPFGSPSQSDLKHCWRLSRGGVGPHASIPRPSGTCPCEGSRGGGELVQHSAREFISAPQPALDTPDLLPTTHLRTAPPPLAPVTSHTILQPPLQSLFRRPAPRFRC